MTATHYCITYGTTRSAILFTGTGIDKLAETPLAVYDRLRYDVEENDFVVIEPVLKLYVADDEKLPDIITLANYLSRLKRDSKITDVKIFKIEESKDDIEWKLKSLHDRMEELQDAFLMAPGEALVVEVGEKKRKIDYDEEEKRMIDCDGVITDLGEKTKSP